MTIDRLFRGSALAWGVLGFALIALDPAIAIQGYGHPRLPAFVHALTLGVFVNGYYALQWGLWQRYYRQVPPWRWMAPLVWAVHQAGLAVMLAGFLLGNLRLALAGAHYLVPAGIALHALHAVVTTWRRPDGVPRQFAAHTPTLGLLVTMALGAMMILSAVTGRYGMYTPAILLVHGLSGAFLFLVPTLRAAETRPHGPLGSWMLWQAGPPALGVLVLAAVPWLGTPAVAVGLAVSGLGLLWAMVWHPGSWRMSIFALPRLLWSIPALVLLYAAARAWQGAPLAEGLALAKVGALSVLLLAGVPELGYRLTVGSARSGAHLAGGVVLLVAAGALVLAGQAAESTLTVQVAALCGCGGLVAVGWPPGPGR